MRERLRAWMPRAMAAACGLALLYALCVSYHDVQTCGGMDLRAKVVAARLANAGIDPYFYLMTRKTPDLWLDPIEPALPSRVTLTPFGLLCYMPVADLYYPFQRQFWFALEWAGLLGALLLLGRTMRLSRGRTDFLIVAILMFACGYFWRLHVERGQYYSFVLALAASAAWLWTRRNAWTWTGGLLLGTAIALRPTMLVIPALLWFMGRRKPAVAAVLGAVLCVALTVPFLGLKEWKTYARAMRAREPGSDVLQPINVEKQLKLKVDGANLGSLLFDCSKDVSLVKYFTWDSGIPFFQHRQEEIGTYARFLAIAWMGTICGYLLLRARPIRRMGHALGFAAVHALAMDYLVPSRWGYTDILFLLPLGLLFPLMIRDARGHWYLAVLAAGLIAAHAMNDAAGTAVRSFVVMATLLTFLFLVLLRPRRRRRLA